jgi:hypothetical protein
MHRFDSGCRRWVYSGLVKLKDFRHDIVGIESDEGFRCRARTPDDAHRNYSNATVLQAGRAPLFRYANRIVLIRRQYRNLCHVSDGPGWRASRRIELTAIDPPRCGAARIDSF